MPAPWVIPAAIAAGTTLAGGIFNSRAESKHAAAQYEWDKYNADMGHATTINNVNNRGDITLFNSLMGLKAMEFQSVASKKIVDYNASLLAATALYNNELSQEELSLVWDQAGLDLLVLENERKRERGRIRANQAASGTVMDIESNANVVIAQMSQEKLDAFIIRHGANVQASRIQNKMAQDTFMAQGEIAKMKWEQEVGSAVNKNNTRTRLLSDMATNVLATQGDLFSARSAFMSGSTGAGFKRSASEQRAQNTFTNSLFSSAGQAASSYYQFRTPKGIDTGESLITGE